MSTEFLGGKTMHGISVQGKVYLLEEDVRRTVNAALETNVAKNATIESLQATNKAQADLLVRIKYHADFDPSEKEASVLRGQMLCIQDEINQHNKENPNG